MRATHARRAIACALSTLAAAACLAGLPGHAAAERYIGLGGGVALPYQGEVGWTVLGEIGGHMWGSKHFLGGTEFEFRRQDASPTTGTEHVPVDLYNVRLLGRFVFSPKTISPYIGLGGGLGAVHARETSTDDSEVGLSASILGLAGLHVPFAEGRIAFFTEARFGFTWDLTGDFSHVDPKGMDGFTAVGGLRFRF